MAVVGRIRQIASYHRERNMRGSLLAVGFTCLLAGILAAPETSFEIGDTVTVHRFKP